MKLYRVTGQPIAIGTDETISLDKAQLADRTHLVRALEEMGERTLVRPNAVIAFKAGEEIGMADELPKRLREFMIPVGDLAEPKKKAEAPEARQAAIIAAIGKIDPENHRLFSRDGVPSVKAIEAALGTDVSISASERDAAWAIIQERTAAAKRGRAERQIGEPMD